jgi:hypothetical protein
MLFSREQIKLFEIPPAPCRAFCEEGKNDTLFSIKCDASRPQKL